MSSAGYEQRATMYAAFAFYCTHAMAGAMATWRERHLLFVGLTARHEAGEQYLRQKYALLQWRQSAHCMQAQREAANRRSSHALSFSAARRARRGLMALEQWRCGALSLRLAAQWHAAGARAASRKQLVAAWRQWALAVSIRRLRFTRRRAASVDPAAVAAQLQHVRRSAALRRGWRAFARLAALSGSSAFVARLERRRSRALAVATLRRWQRNTSKLAASDDARMRAESHNWTRVWSTWRAAANRMAIGTQLLDDASNAHGRMLLRRWRREVEVAAGRMESASRVRERALDGTRRRVVRHWQQVRRLWSLLAHSFAKCHEAHLLRSWRRGWTAFRYANDISQRTASARAHARRSRLSRSISYWRARSIWIAVLGSYDSAHVRLVTLRRAMPRWVSAYQTCVAAALAKTRALRHLLSLSLGQWWDHVRWRESAHLAALADEARCTRCRMKRVWSSWMRRLESGKARAYRMEGLRSIWRWRWSLQLELSRSAQREEDNYAAQCLRAQRTMRRWRLQTAGAPRPLRTPSAAELVRRSSYRGGRCLDSQHTLIHVHALRRWSRAAAEQIRLSVAGRGGGGRGSMAAVDFGRLRRCLLSWRRLRRLAVSRRAEIVRQRPELEAATLAVQLAKLRRAWQECFARVHARSLLREKVRRMRDFRIGRSMAAWARSWARECVLPQQYARRSALQSGWAAWVEAIVSWCDEEVEMHIAATKWNLSLFRFLEAFRALNVLARHRAQRRTAQQITAEARELNLRVDMAEALERWRLPRRRSAAQRLAAHRLYWQELWRRWVRFVLLHRRKLQVVRLGRRRWLRQVFCAWSGFAFTLEYRYERCLEPLRAARPNRQVQPGELPWVPPAAWHWPCTDQASKPGAKGEGVPQSGVARLGGGHPLTLCLRPESA